MEVLDGIFIKVTGSTSSVIPAEAGIQRKNARPLSFALHYGRRLFRHDGDRIKLVLPLVL